MIDALIKRVSVTYKCLISFSHLFWQFRKKEIQDQRISIQLPEKERCITNCLSVHYY
jgi:hypothetical protein